MDSFAAKPSYTEKNWDRVLEKWCATQAEAFTKYPPGHPVLAAIEDICLAIGEPEEYSEAVSRYLKLVRNEFERRV